MIYRILFFIATTALGIAILKYTLKWVTTVGKSGWAETHLGTGGTYTMWRIIAALIMVFGFLVLIGQIDLAPRTVQVQSENEFTGELGD